MMDKTIKAVLTHKETYRRYYDLPDDYEQPIIVLVDGKEVEAKVVLDMGENSEEEGDEIKIIYRPGGEQIKQFRRKTSLNRSMEIPIGQDLWDEDQIEKIKK